MKLKSLILTTTCLLSTLILIGMPASAASCSPATVSGDFGYSFSGFVLAPSGTFVPVAGAGKITFNKDGSVTGTQTRSLAGSALDETYSGTYAVSQDCTGSFTVTVQPDTRVSTVKLIWTDDSNAASAVFTNPGFVLSVVAHRVHTRD